MTSVRRLKWLMPLATIGLLMLSTSTLAQTPAPAPAAAPAWRTSWEALSQALDEYRQRGSTLPTPSFDGFLKGERIPMTVGVMKAFNGQVALHGTFNGVKSDPSVLMDGMKVKLDIAILGKGFKHIYPAEGSVEVWRALAPGSAVRFSATITGLAAIPFPDGAIGYMMLLENAVILR